MRQIPRAVLKQSRISFCVFGLSLILCLLGISCGEDEPTEFVVPELFTIDATLSPAIATVGIVEWSFDGGQFDSASVEFGLSEEYGMSAPVDISDVDHRTLLLGMKPSQEYHFEVRVTVDGILYRSGDNLITTGSVINGLAAPNITVGFPDDRAGGFMVTGTYNHIIDDKSVAYILDADGEYVWWYQATISNISRARMTYDGHYMVLIPVNNDGEDGFIEFVSMDGLRAKVFAIPSATHDFTPIPDNRIAFISVDKQGEEIEPCGKIEIVDVHGSMKTIFDTSALWQSPCHHNAIRYSADENIFTLSDLVHSQIIGVSMEGELLWTANRTGSQWEKQHGHHFLGDSLLVFSNENSDIFEYAFTGDIEEELLWSYSSMYSSMHLGDVQRLPNGNTLITYSDDGIIQEVSGSGEPVQTIALGQHVPGYVSWRSSLYGSPNDVQQ